MEKRNIHIQSERDSEEVKGFAETINMKKQEDARKLSMMKETLNR